MSLPRFSFTIGRKIYAIIALCFLGCLGIMGLQLNQLWSGLEGQKKLELSHLANVALSVLQEEHAAAQAGQISMEEAKKRAAARVGALRYGPEDYFWINDMHPRVVMHPLRPQTNGSDVSNTKDADGMLLYKAFVDVVKREGRGIVWYNWNKPGGGSLPKLSYVAGFAPWGWVVGTGVLVEDLKQQTWELARQALLVAGLVLVVTAAVSVLVARRTSKSMHGMTSAMDELASGNFDVVLPGLGRGDEIGAMAKAVEGFKLRAVEKGRRESAEKRGGRRRGGGRAQGGDAQARRCRSKPLSGILSRRFRRPRASLKAPPAP